MDYPEKYDPIPAWLGREVVDYLPGEEVDFANFYRIATRQKKRSLLGKVKVEGISGEHCFHEFLKLDRVDRCTGLVLGCYESAEHEDWEDVHRQSIAMLVENAHRLPGLRHLYLGDFSADQHYDISMALGGDISALLHAYPALESLRINSTHPELKPVRHICLQSLVIVGSGLTDPFLENLGKCIFTDLTELVLCPGGDEYGGLGEKIASVEAFIQANPFPKLKKLGLCSSSAIDRIIEILSDSDMLKQLEALDLSLGTLSDRGADALLGGEAFRSLQALDLFHHFLSEEKVAALQTAFHHLKLNVDRGEADEDGEDYRYVAISE